MIILEIKWKQGTRLGMKREKRYVKEDKRKEETHERKI
jgi:hypothetical protein